MESLLATYASDDDDHHNDQTLDPCLQFPPHKRSSSIPAPNSAASLFASLPPPSGGRSSSAAAYGRRSEADVDNEVKGATFTTIDPSPVPSKPKGSFFAALPPPSGGRSSSAAALGRGSEEDVEKEAKGTIFAATDATPDRSKPKVSIFAALPAPKPQNHRRVVHFRPPIDPSLLKRSDFDEDDEDEEEKRKFDQISAAPTLGSSYSSLLPAPKNSLGLGASLGSGSSRISVVEADVPAENTRSSSLEQESHNFENYGNNGGGWAGAPTGAGVSEATGSEFYAAGDDSGYYSSGAEASTYLEHASGGTDASGWDPNYAGYGSYEGSLTYESVPATTSEAVPDMGRIGGKRGRNEIPAEIVEVKQDELMKNRPRQDQAKLTGIAFGPSYQPASSAKGKPSKLHKRKHQIGSLFFDMKQKEMELAERRSRGLLTKAQTQGKYGW